MNAGTATLSKITSGRGLYRTTVYQLHATCDRCGRDNLHGGGTDPARLHDSLGHRASHCRCPNGYFIVDPNQVIERFQRARAA